MPANTLVFVDEVIRTELEKQLDSIPRSFIINHDGREPQEEIRKVQATDELLWLLSNRGQKCGVITAASLFFNQKGCSP